MGINRAINLLFKEINHIPFTVQYSTGPSSAFQSSICSSSPHFVSSVRLSVCPLLRTARTPTVNIILCASLSLLLSLCVTEMWAPLRNNLSYLSSFSLAPSNMHFYGCLSRFSVVFFVCLFLKLHDFLARSVYLLNWAILSRYFAFINTKAKTGRSAGDSQAKRKWEIYTASVFYILPLKSFCIDLSTLICTIKLKWLIEAMLFDFLSWANLW